MECEPYSVKFLTYQPALSGASCEIITVVDSFKQADKQSSLLSRSEDWVGSFLH